MTRDPLTSIEGVCEVRTVAEPGADPRTAPDLLIEMPHGATRLHDYRDIRERLVGPLPADLEAFFFVNTDVGAPECAAAIASLVTGPGDDPHLAPLSGPETLADGARRAPRKVLIVRGLVPRTFIDCNRVVGYDSPEFRKAGFTTAVPPYITDPADVATLVELYRQYQRVAENAYSEVCGAGGMALTLHTYAPRSVDVEVDADVVASLRQAYAPGVYERWKPRPEVEVISEASDGTLMAAPELVREARRLYARVGIEVAENATYRLHPATMGHRHAARFPGRVLCVEINRGCLGEPFTPFQEMRVPPQRAFHMAAPLAALCRGQLARRASATHG